MYQLTLSYSNLRGLLTEHSKEQFYTQVDTRKQEKNIPELVKN